MKRASVMMVLCLAATMGCKKKDTAKDLATLAQDDPAKAIPMLMERYQKTPDDYSTIRLLASAHMREQPPKWERAAAWLRKALDHPNGHDKDERTALQDDLRRCVEAQVAAGEASGLDAKKLVALLKEQNRLERALGRQDIKAGKALFERAKKQFDGYVKAEEYDKAILLIGGLDQIYVDGRTAETLKSQLPKLLGLKFHQDALAAFNSAVRADAIEQGVYDDGQKAFVFPGHAEVIVGAEGAPDPTSAGFGKTLEELACGQTVILPELKDVLSPFAKASPLGRELSSQELVQFYKFAKDKRKTRWEGEAWDASKVYEPGTKLSLLCMDSVSLDTTLNAFQILANKDAKKRGAAQ